MNYLLFENEIATITKCDDEKVPKTNGNNALANRPPV